MISLILPYWDRQEAADKAIASLAKYEPLDMEVLIIDDGNPVPFRIPETPLNLRVIRLPEKTEPKSPVTCWNEGVRQAKGDIIVLSCVEVLHPEPILAELAAAVFDDESYVLAAAWCPEENRWHAHSSIHPPQNAPGTGQAFCAALTPALYWKAGGFDEAYREGAGYEDCDFINRMLKAGAKFIKRDDLKVIHPKAKATIHWKPEAFARNKALFYSKWPDRKPVTFVCLKAGEMYGPEYVNILFDMVRRNLSDGYPGRFVCITNDPKGLDERIEVLPLPADLERWWGKLYMFKRGLFPDGERLIFMDLDTLIVGNLDKLAGYQGQFATLEDFMQPQRLGPAIIAWEAGAFAASIWEEWVSEGKPRHPMGDLWWLNNLNQGRFPKMVDKLQKVFPGDFCSFKRDCKTTFPKGAKVVCFHGEPRPHNCQEEWVQRCWKVGGGTAAELAALCNVNRDQLIANVRYSINSGAPTLKMDKAHQGHAVIVGGGPSLTSTLGELRYRKGLGQTIFATNGAGRFLAKNGIEPDYLVILDARPENARFLMGCPTFLASHCHPSLFDASAATLYHVNTDGIDEALEGKPADLISTGSTVGLVAMGIAHVLGYRKFHLYGMDSSITEKHHAYDQPENDGDSVISATVGDRTFRCAPWMVLQAQQFQALATLLAEENCIITVAGDGLLPHVAHEMSRTYSTT